VLYRAGASEATRTGPRPISPPRPRLPPPARRPRNRTLAAQHRLEGAGKPGDVSVAIQSSS